MALLVAAAAMAGCARVGGDATQVAAKVNDTELSLSQLNHVLQRQPPVSPERAEAQARRVLEGLIEQELAAQAARDSGLDRDPRIVQTIEAAKREILAKAYQDTLADKAPLPSSDEIDRYYDSQPALFSERRFYSLQEISVRGSTEQLLSLQPRVESAPDAARAAELLREAQLRFTSRQLTVSPEDIPLAMLDRFAKLREGQSLMLAQPGGARIVTLLASHPAPLSRELARPQIQAFLINERKRQAVHEAMKSMRDSARVEYKGKFAQAGPAPSTAASAPQVQ
jgi:EpsD family peptidyl-prolyl cis-trans isomerase